MKVTEEGKGIEGNSWCEILFKKTNLYLHNVTKCFVNL